MKPQRRGRSKEEESPPTTKKSRFSLRNEKEAKGKSKKTTEEGIAVDLPISISGRPWGAPPDPQVAKLVSYNVSSLRSALGKSKQLLDAFINFECPDLLAVQEIKLSEPIPEDIKAALQEHYETCLFHPCRSKRGYSGTAIFLRKSSRLGEPLRTQHGFDSEVNVEDSEGRVIIIEFASCIVCAMYVPNSGAGLKRLEYRIQVWDEAVRVQLNRLQQQSQKPVIWCGDLNCAHQEIDIWNPEGNRRSAGFTDEERASFSQTLRECAFLDTFRWLHPSVRAYSYIGHRHVQNYLQNRGWRLDYFCCSANAASRIVDSYMRFDIEIHARAYQQREVERHQVRRLSDHCPVVFLFRVG
ncbi:hypothetical protein CCYA_CCYA14G3741 [Cyanidiococcus yangmingshanensis]|nr:hypothetical protein CCYA_CCYA14G3741 [Cyanidiococcus yangmingshanensis]